MTKYALPIFTVLALQFLNTATAQNNAPLKQGRVVYEQQIKGGTATLNINGNTQTVNRPDRTLRMEVLFTQEESLRRQLESNERPEVEMAGPGDMPSTVGTVRVIGSFMSEAAIWHNFTEARKVEQRESAGKKFLVQDSIRKNTWKLTGETKTILGYTCQKAVTRTPVKSFNMQMQDGQMKRTEKWDTIDVTVWFAPAITIPAGPDYQGQLPGLILETESRNGSNIVRAVEISDKVKITEIKEPKTGKKVTQAEYMKEVEESQKQMMERMRPARAAF
ncbi:MAG: GLPGLI family protein [Pseudobacter sp.]|uniref:GLPGLI family protein n=1 Tax=Pseudobacter sp. TaxID=2045420 RepID=UPI003F809809